jgi:predicted small secreted protein
MRHKNRWLVALLIIVSLQLAACIQTADQASQGGGEEPARVEPVAGTDFSRVILTAEAAKRLNIQTAPVHDVQAGGTAMKVVAYSALIYGLHGESWVYTNPEPLTYVRAAITVDHIDGGLAYLLDGPPSGTSVVTVGAPELYGVETGVGE